MRKSVANHLNDITKDHPDLVMTLLEGWPHENSHTAWIANRALRTLIKRGDARALAVIGAGEKPRVEVTRFAVTPGTVRIGDDVTLTLELRSTSKKAQRLVVDCVVHYVKKSGATSEKVFKWKELSLAPGAAWSPFHGNCVSGISPRACIMPGSQGGAVRERSKAGEGGVPFVRFPVSFNSGSSYHRN